MKRLFADTFYFLATINRRDPIHARALSIRRELDAHCITTQWILTEVADALCVRPNRGAAIHLLRGLRQQRELTIVPASEALFQRGLEFYCSRADQEWSLTDCISFVVMRDEKLTEALTGDHHFEQAGFAALLS